jgi:5'-nucleotidase
MQRTSARAPARILISNDDGYSSEGLQVLAAALEPLGEVWVVAPNRERSAVSHALTLDRPLRLTEMGRRRWALDGTPTDCVAVGVSHLLAGRGPDLVVAGINLGVNMGADVHYSGTVAAALEGVILGVPAIAVSQQVDTVWRFETAAELAREIAAWCLASPPPAGTLLNVNVPTGPVRGVRLTRLGARRYTEGIIEDVDPRGRQILWVGGGQPVWEATPGTDFHELAGGYVSVTPLNLDMTDQDLLARLGEAAPEWMQVEARHA